MPAYRAGLARARRGVPRREPRTVRHAGGSSEVRESDSGTSRDPTADVVGKAGQREGVGIHCLQAPTLCSAIAGVVAVLATVAILSWLLPQPAAAQAVPSVRLELERASVGVDDEFDVIVTIQDAKSLGGFQFTLAYDAARLARVSADVTDFLGSTGREVTVLGPIYDVGTVTLGAVSSGTAAQRGPDGSGDLAFVRFRALSEGVAALDLTQVLLVDTDNERTEVDGVGTTVTIGPTLIPSPTSPQTATSLPSPTTEGTPAPTAATPPRPEGYDVYMPAAYRHL